MEKRLDQIMKKMLYLKSPLETNSILDLYSKVLGIPESTTAENLIIGAVMPSHEEARNIIVKHLFSGEMSVKGTLSKIFRISGAGYRWSVPYPEVSRLIQFVVAHAEHGNVDPEDPAFSDLEYEFRSIVEFLCDGPDTNFPFCVSAERRREGKRCRELEEMLKNSPADVSLEPFYEILMNNWDVFKYWASAHHLLAALVALEKDWDDSAEAKVELIRVIKEESEKWTGESRDEKPLVKKILDLQHDIVVRNFWAVLMLIGLDEVVGIELAQDREKFNSRPFGEYSGGNYFEGLPNYFREHLDGNEHSIKTLCFQDMPFEDGEKERLYYSLRRLFDDLDKDMTQFREEWFDTERYGELKERARRLKEVKP